MLDVNSSYSTMLVHSYEIVQDSGVIVIGFRNISMFPEKLSDSTLRESS